MTHIPVLLQEAIEYLDPKPGRKYIDATVGEGGHAREIISKGGIVLGIDQDPEVTKWFRNNAPQPPLSAQGGSASGGNIRGGEGELLRIVQGSFADLRVIAEEHGFAEVDGILFDLGLGSHQLDNPERGFSFQKEGPLDMRYNSSRPPLILRGGAPSVSAQGGSASGGRVREGGGELRAADILNNYSEKELVFIFYRYGEERRFGKKVAQAIAQQRKFFPIETTSQLFDLIKKCLPGKFRFKAGNVARRIFQALRIEVNQELKNLEKALPQALELLKEHGRLAVISFHSLEDRLVKDFFVTNAKDCVCPPSFPVCRCQVKAGLRILTKKPITPSPQEIQTNPRAHSAKLRVAEKI